MTPGERGAERLPMLGDLRGGIMVFEPMAIKELSRAGATIETRFKLQLNSLHDLRIELGDRSVIVKGRVVHSKISDVDQDVVVYRSGVEFVEPEDRIVAALDEFLEAVKANRSGVSAP
jgi:hypothetical protein